jgi:hypothetical protein
MAYPSDVSGFVIGKSPIGGYQQKGMRTYGRVYSDPQTYTWQEVQTDQSGSNDYVYLTGLIQELKLNLGESPFWANRGIPAGPSVVQQIAPDFYVMQMQQRYAPYFLNITIVKVPGGTDSEGSPAPTYRINVTMHYNQQLEAVVPV